VLFSEIGHDTYRLEKTTDQGLSLDNAQEVSLKNATLEMTRQFAQRVRFQPGEFKITSVDKTRFSVAGLAWPEGGAAPVYEVLRPLDVQVHGKPTFWQLELGEGTEAPAAKGSTTTFSYSVLDEAPRVGDIVRVLDMPRAGQIRVTECAQPFVGTGSLPADDLLPLVRHAAYRSTRYQVRLAGDTFFTDANKLLEAGFFKRRLEPAAATEVCVKPGYAVKPESGQCAAGKCSAQVLVASTLILDKAGERTGNVVQAERVSFEDVTEDARDGLIGFTAHDTVRKHLPKLIDKFTTPSK
jgi:hypothetical protein